MAAVPPAAPRLFVLTLGLLACAAPAGAQTMNANSASYNAGYGRTAGSENQPVNVSTRDANGNRVIVDGLILTGEDQSSFSSASGAIDSFAGVGASSGGSTAIGNSLVVVTQGNYNTVIINSTQTNTGAVTATTKVNSGGVGNGQ
ncbi:holdfast anchoring protein HfaA [Phenylobacterium aquaticum]|jgi:holdfast attachment protein HfaA|uniref:holdfast anchoring protein HfaA n=1 Tax=Phenylobacterium aquaticum TaxID=1763816 RepID=UPI001F5DBD88|nr:holdfast anchoring protein HfaA [Phenylobacterium aquaticum]MCI3132617.1 holdfast anchoring protein HfaA [Phenylobacterium aquaticum]